MMFRLPIFFWSIWAQSSVSIKGGLTSSEIEDNHTKVTLYPQHYYVVHIYTALYFYSLKYTSPQPLKAKLSGYGFASHQLELGKLTLYYL